MCAIWRVDAWPAIRVCLPGEGSLSVQAVALLAFLAVPRLAGPRRRGARGRPAHRFNARGVEGRAASAAANHLPCRRVPATPAPAEEPRVGPAALGRLEHWQASATVDGRLLGLAHGAVPVWRLFGGAQLLLRCADRAAQRRELGLERLDPLTVCGILCAEPLRFELIDCGTACHR